MELLFKIYGERNSGTNYLSHLLRRNFPYVKVFDQVVINDTMYYWKHGIPSGKIYKEKKFKNHRIIHFFIYRNVKSWLKSMYKNNYHLEPKPDYFTFLTGEQHSSENYFKDFRTDQCLNQDDNNKTILEIRYFKLKGIFDFVEQHNNCVVVNLDFLQKNHNTILFIKEINRNFTHLKMKAYDTKIDHIKTKEPIQNRQYEIEESEDIETYLHKHIKHKLEKKLPKLYIKKMII